jgi:glutaminyl-peptide cyclotransferase
VSDAPRTSSWGLWLLLLGGAAAAVVLFAWSGGPPPAAPAPPGQDPPPAFDAAASFADLKTVFDLGPRHHGSPGLAACRALLETRFREAGAEVRADAFTYTGISGSPEPFANVFGRFRGRSPGAPPVLVGTHHDTQALCHADPDPAKRDLPVPGANDGGSGVAVLLELARVFRRQPPPVPVILAGFDGEDFGGPGEKARDYLVGSRHHAETLDARPADRPAAVVIVDLVAEKGATFPRRPDFQFGAGALADAIWGTAARLGVGAFEPRSAASIYDDHSAFLDRGIPALVIIDLDYGPGNAWWHTSADTLDKCGAETLGAVGRVVTAWIYAGAPGGR